MKFAAGACQGLRAIFGYEVDYLVHTRSLSLAARVSQDTVYGLLQRSGLF